MYFDVDLQKVRRSMISPPKCRCAILQDADVPTCEFRDVGDKCVDLQTLRHRCVDLWSPCIASNFLMATVAVVAVHILTVVTVAIMPFKAFVTIMQLVAIVTLVPKFLEPSWNTIVQMASSEWPRADCIVGSHGANVSYKFHRVDSIVVDYVVGFYPASVVLWEAWVRLTMT